MKAILFFLFFICTLICKPQNPVLYGMTGGGANGRGCIFRINGDGTGFQNVFSFDSLSGHGANGRLIQASDGNLYGMLENGGANNYGVIFKFNPLTNYYTIVHHFDSINGSLPRGSLFQATNGGASNNGPLYGMTSWGGIYDLGVMFSFDINNNFFEKLHDFNDTNGGHPVNNFIQGLNGNLYGVTTGSVCHAGVLFEYNRATSTFNQLVDLCQYGHAPEDNMILDAAGNLYGFTTSSGFGNPPYGTLFKYTTSGVFSTLFTFGSGGLGQRPQGSPVLINNEIYGMTNSGGMISNAGGELFKYNFITHTYSTLYSHIMQDTMGSLANAGLMRASNGNLYGMLLEGSNNAGVIISYDINSQSYQKIHDFDFINGGGPSSELLEVDTLLFTLNAAELFSFTNIFISPNPVLNVLNISLDKYSEPIQIGFYDCFGRLMKIERARKDNFTIEVSDLPSGIYILKILGVNARPVKIVKN